MTEGAVPGVEGGLVAPTRVLVFDDEETSCAAAQAALSAAGFVVDATTNALVLYRCIQNDASPYDVIVADGGHRDLPPHEFARRMRSRHPEVALAVATRSFHVLRAPYDAWIEKPYPAAALVELVKTAGLARERRRGRSTAN